VQILSKFPYLPNTSPLNTPIFILFCFIFPNHPNPPLDCITALQRLRTRRIPVSIFFSGGGIHLLLFLNYYRYANWKMLFRSKGNPQFCFGDAGNPKTFNKKDIREVIEHRSSTSARNPFTGFKLIEIILQNGRTLIIPNLMINTANLENKLFEHPATTIYKALSFK
jgi:hypothetical protein